MITVFNKQKIKRGRKNLKRLLYSPHECERPKSGIMQNLKPNHYMYELKALRDEYREYFFILKNYLESQGITLNSVYTTDAMDAQFQKKSEYAIYFFDVANRTFALPGEHGLNFGLRCIDSDELTSYSVVEHEIFLAAGTDGRMIYGINGKGKLIVINPDEDCDEEKRFCVTQQVIDPLSYCMKVAESTLSENQITDEISAIQSDGIVPVRTQLFDRVFYDSKEQHFFCMRVDGNFYHGYDVDYFPMSRDEVITFGITSNIFSIKDVVDTCRDGKVHPFVLLSYLPCKEGPYSPPDNFGYGRYFI